MIMACELTLPGDLMFKIPPIAEDHTTTPWDYVEQLLDSHQTSAARLTCGLWID